jgi:hypothetical protein
MAILAKKQDNLLQPNTNYHDLPSLQPRLAQCIYCALSIIWVFKMGQRHEVS